VFKLITYDYEPPVTDASKPNKLYAQNVWLRYVTVMSSIIWVYNVVYHNSGLIVDYLCLQCISRDMFMYNIYSCIYQLLGQSLKMAHLYEPKHVAWNTL
jgi:hypothetical protein